MKRVVFRVLLLLGLGICIICCKLARQQNKVTTSTITHLNLAKGHLKVIVEKFNAKEDELWH